MDKKILQSMFEEWAGEKMLEMNALPQSGSYREYYRILGNSKKAIGVYNADLKENVAFLTFTKHFASKGIKVPAILAEEMRNEYYLLEDLGDTTLFQFAKQYRNGNGISAELIEMYKKVIDEMPKIQILAAADFDYSVCYPRASFDFQSMHWDLSYFKYYFLKLAKIAFDEQLLEDDYHTFIAYLLEADCNYFLYRDFQSRNIMIHNNLPYFIDYQGGRQGALQYDLASLLYDSKAELPNDVRTYLLDYYITEASKYTEINREQFIEYFRAYSLIRLMQAMGAYGFRGFYEKKEMFLESIPVALRDLKDLLELLSENLKTIIPSLYTVLQRVTESEELKQIWKPSHKLKVSVQSFSYRKTIPEDKSGNGGGFVFDCRALPNPGRIAGMEKCNGTNKEVSDYLSAESSVNSFLQNVFQMLDFSVENYLQRNFTNLQVSFGCTGGQHRSVFCAEQMAKHLREKYDIDIELKHNQLSK